MSTRAFITGVSGLKLTAEERAFLQAEQPWGFILFKRNIETRRKYRRWCGNCANPSPSPTPRS